MLKPEGKSRDIVPWVGAHSKFLVTTYGKSALGQLHITLDLSTIFHYDLTLTLLQHHLSAMVQVCVLEILVLRFQMYVQVVLAQKAKNGVSLSLSLFPQSMGSLPDSITSPFTCKY